MIDVGLMKSLCGRDTLGCECSVQLVFLAGFWGALSQCYMTQRENLSGLQTNGQQLHPFPLAHSSQRGVGGIVRVVCLAHCWTWLTRHHNQQNVVAHSYRWLNPIVRRVTWSVSLAIPTGVSRPTRRDAEDLDASMTTEIKSVLTTH